MKFMCADAAGSGSNIVVYVILIVMVLAMLILPYFSNKKRTQQYNEMIASIKVGCVVKTAGGIIGRVTKISDKGQIKTIILETGSKTGKSYMEFDINSIYCILESTKAEKVKEEVVEEKVEEVAEEKTEEPKEEVEKSVEPKKTTKAKKTTTSKTKK